MAVWLAVCQPEKVQERFREVESESLRALMEVKAFEHRTMHLFRYNIFVSWLWRAADAALSIVL